MKNISNRLKELFHASLNSSNKPTVSDYRAPSYHQTHIGFDDEDYNGIIYFYEWSDIKRSPKTFYTMKGFETFLRDSGIFIAGYQRELIRNLNNAYVTCLRNTKDLLIKCSYDSLRISLNNESGGNNQVPYNVQCTHPPMSMVHRPMTIDEPNNRWDRMEKINTWFG